MFNKTGRCDGTCDTCDCQPAKVIDLAQQKHKRMVLDAWDRMEREQGRKIADERAEVERAARDRV